MTQRISIHARLFRLASFKIQIAGCKAKFLSVYVTPQHGEFNNLIGFKNVHFFNLSDHF